MRDLPSHLRLHHHRSNVGRRQLLRWLGGGAGAAAGVSMLPSLSRAQSREVVELNMWASGTMTIDDYWRRLEEDEGIRINFSDNGNDPGPVIARMVFGNANDLYDVGGLQGGAERELGMQDAIVPWDMSKVPNWDEVWNWAKEIPYIHHDGEQYGIPTVINADSMIYLPERVGTVDTYAFVFDPALKGKTAMEDAWINSVIFTAIYLKENNLVPIENPGDLSEDELGAVMEFLIKHKRDGQFRTFWSGWEQGVQLIASEEVWVMTGWEPIVYAARERGVNAEYAVPKEGYEGWSNDLLLHRGCVERDKADAAHRLANWELGGYYGCALGKLRGYMVPTDRNVEVARAHSDEFDPEFHENLAEHVKAKFFSMKGAVYWQNVRPENFQLYEEWWQRLRNV